MSRTSKLSASQKLHVIEAIEDKTWTVTELANYYNCHPRTIYRVLEEVGMGTAQTSRKMSAGKRALEIMAKHGISVEQLDSVLRQAATFTIPRTPAASKMAALFHPAPTVAGAAGASLTGSGL